MSQYFAKLYEPFGGDINVKVELSNYATKADIKNTSQVDTSRFALKSTLASLKSEVDKLYIDKLVPIPVDLSKLSDVVTNNVFKKTVYDKLVAKVNSTDTSAFVLKTKYNTGIKSQKIKFLILVVLIKKQNAILKSSKQRVKYQVLVFYLASLSAHLFAIRRKRKRGPGTL